MKKITALLLLFIAVKASAQQTVLFKMKYMPQRTYGILMNMKAEIHADLSGNQEIIDKLKEKGITMPLVADIGFNTTGTTKTGVLGADNSFPLTMSFQIGQPNITLNGKSTPIPIPQKPAEIVYAHVSADGILKGDSISGKKADSSGKAALQLMNTVQKNIKFPDHPIKVGESFTQDVPFNMPNMGNSSVDSKAVYTLVSITDGKAYFDISQTINMKMNIQQAQVTIAGSGSGKMVYSIKDSFPISYNTIINMNVDGAVSTVTVKGSLVLNLDMAYDIK
ncbi:hypothetical protein HDF24_04305 [Mucilaginibacter sp. X4EP1]|jgi:hypothetical protein|uniref:hypothetical protein n=1 Tax=Mucilaginibacter sp. X4EP1 TaxID=2723092 RepID=UPI00216898DF|nr:hypothetical protein [Mucilaginibacter sp. X4EP1]MCS3816206.1 hypothetical protein [Mucilaginibacter sp. X4EP1]